jgi:guanyl-specific ribonuclease Sa
MAGFLLLASACGSAPVPPAPTQIQAQVHAEGAVPSYARETLAYIRQHGDAPPGFVGGRVFGNYEGSLPRFDSRRKRIAYREWDVHPRAEGRNRGTERLITGNDGRAWFTADHYRSFVEVK